MNKELLLSLGFNEEVQRVEQGLCPFCGKPVFLGEFRDVLSLEEFQISGLCQKCQDEVFGD